MYNSPDGDVDFSLSFSAYYIRAKRVLKRLVGASFSLQLVFESCSSQEKLDSEGCRSILQLVERLNEPIQDLCQLLEKRYQHISPCYTLEITTFYTNEQLQNLVQIVEQFCSCRRPSAKKEGLERQILCKLEIIVTTNEDLISGIPLLLDQPCFEDIRSVRLRPMAQKTNIIIPLHKRVRKKETFDANLFMK